MGDTQRSETISTESLKIARTVACNSTPIEWGCPPVLTGETSLIKIKLLAQRDPELVFTSVVHRIDFDLLKQSFRKIRKSESTGVDKVTAKEYAKDLDQNLYNLYERLRRGQ